MQFKNPSNNYDEVVQQLEEYGTAQNRKIYARHGANPDKVFGVSFANLNILAKKIGNDHGLARCLWKSGNYDCRNLATKIAEPRLMDAAEIMEWVQQLTSYVHVSLFGNVVARSPAAKELLPKLCKSPHEIHRGLGYSTLSSMLAHDPNCLTPAKIAMHLKQLERDIQQSPNWARYSMNWALISIGTYCEELKDAAIAAAKRIGKVEVDHGETSCKTPDAAPYIEKASAHYLQKKK